MRILFFALVVAAAGAGFCRAEEAMVVYDKKLSDALTVLITKRSGDEEAPTAPVLTGTLQLTSVISGTLPTAALQSGTVQLETAQATVQVGGTNAGALPLITSAPDGAQAPGLAMVTSGTGLVKTGSGPPLLAVSCGAVAFPSRPSTPSDEAAAPQGTLVHEILLKRPGKPDESLWEQKTFARNGEDAPRALAVALGEKTGAMLYTFRGEVRVRTFSAGGEAGGDEQVLGRWMPGMTAALVSPEGEGALRATLQWKEAGKAVKWVWTLGGKAGKPQWIFAPEETARMQALRKSLLPIMDDPAAFAQVKDLISKEKMPPDLCDDTGATTLMNMARAGNLEAVQFLLSKGAEVKRKDFQGRDALGWAVKSGNLDLVKFLLAHGADMNATDDDGMTELQRAVMYAPSEMAGWLIVQGSQVDTRDLDGRNALFYAVEQNHVQLVATLLEKHADPLVRDVEGENALSTAKEGGNEKVIAALGKAGRF